MINLEAPETATQAGQQRISSPILLAGGAAAEQLAGELQDRELACRYMYLTLESDTNAGSFSYQQLVPALSQAQQLGLQMVIVADPVALRLSVGIQKQPGAPFQLLNVHQLSVLLANTLAEQAPEQGFACLHSVVITDMLETVLLRRGYACKTDIVDSEALEAAGTELLAAEAVSEVLIVTERGEFWSNKGFAYLVEKLIRLQQDLARHQQGLFDR